MPNTIKERCAHCGYAIEPSPTYEGVNQTPRLAVWWHTPDAETGEAEQDDDHEAIPHPYAQEVEA
jgi:hypothetical protein